MTTMELTIKSLFVLLVVAGMPAWATEQRSMMGAGANPIRKVVTMLQMMTNKVEAEGAKQQELFDKYMCYCKSAGDTLSKSVEDAKKRIPELESDIEEAVALKAQLEDDIKAHKADREAAKAAMAKATAIRNKEADDFAKETADNQATIAALKKALAAIEKGMGAAFMQTRSASVLRRIVTARQDLDEDDRQTLMAFLSSGTDAPAFGNEYAPASGEIVGILKQMLEEMQKDNASTVADEEAAVQQYKQLIAAKKKEIKALSELIEAKLVRVGELGVKIATDQNDLADLKEGLAEDETFLADLEKNCATKKAEWDEICKTRQEELVALADTIKILNDDDALDLFKKTLPSFVQYNSFLQIQVTDSDLRASALSLLQRAVSRASRPQMDFIVMALRGRKVGFAQVIKVIDEMVMTLKKEQVADDDKKSYCESEFDKTDDQKKTLERSLADLETSLEKVKGDIAATKEELEDLEDGIKALDKEVAEATEQRKAENADYKELMANDSAAKEVIKFAKNRLSKFYNPKLYKPPPKRELTEEERITVNNGGTLAPTNPPGGIAGTGIAFFAQVSARSDQADAPPPAPEGPGAYSKKTEESNGVMAMMDNLIKDLDKEMTESEAEEKNSQADYEAFMKSSAAKRAEDSKSITDKEDAIAEMEGELEKLKEAKVSGTKELAATLKYISSLHSECDWLQKFFDVRKEARASEIDALEKAKAVLSGADYSLLQTESHHFLQRRR